MAIQLLKPLVAKPEFTRDQADLNKINCFNLKEYRSEISKEKVLFLKELYQLSLPEYRINKTSAVYFFKAGKSYVELDITIGKDIHIKPYFHYEPENIKKDFYRIFELDYLLYSILKINRLQ